MVKANRPLPDLVQLLWVSDDDLDTHFQLGLLEAEVQAGNFGIDNTFCHFYMENKQHVKYLFATTKHEKARHLALLFNCPAREEMRQFTNY